MNWSFNIFDTSRLATETQRQVYTAWLASAHTDEMKNLVQIREYYEGRQFASLGDFDEFVSVGVKELLLKYPMCNIVRSAVDVVAERLNVLGVTSSQNKGLGDVFQEWWQANEMPSWQQELYQDTLRDSISFIVVGWNGERPVWTLNEAVDAEANTGCRAHFDSDGKLMFVSKRWREHDVNDKPTGRTRLTVYFPDRIERYIDATGLTLVPVEQLQAEDPFITANPQPWLTKGGKPMGIAAVPFYNFPFVSEASDAMVTQAILNENVLSWYVAGRYAGTPLTVLENAKSKIDPATNKAVKLKVGPGRIIELTSDNSGNSAPTKFYRLPAENLQAIYEGLVRPTIAVFCNSKRWPTHLFNIDSLPTSGEVIRRLEAPFVTQVNSKKPMLSDSWQALLRVSANIASTIGGISALEMDDKAWADVTIRWADSSIGDRLADLAILEREKITLELPLRETWRRSGMTEEAIAALWLERLEEQAQARQMSMADLQDNLSGNVDNYEGQ